MSRTPDHAYAHDVVEHLADSESQLASLSRQLEHAQRLSTLGTLAAGIAHEINNILTPVLAYAQLAAKSPGDTALLEKSCQRTIQGVETISQILQAMLGFASVHDQPSEADVHEVIQSSLACIGHDWSRDGINVVVRVPPGTRAQIRPLALQQILINLILNAGNALRSARMRGVGNDTDRLARSKSPARRLGPAPAAGEIKISCRYETSETISISVSDNGPGIPPNVAGRLFQPFARGATHPAGNANQSRASVRTCAKTMDREGDRAGDEHHAVAGGTGLGLSVCKNLVEAAGGSISAASTPGSRTVFTITLPSVAMRRARAS